MAQILIVGCGKLGRPLARQLALEGHHVTGIRRNIQPPADASINWQAIDICAPAALKAVAKQFDQVIIILPPASRSPQGYAQIYQHGLGLLLNHLTTLAPNCGCLFVSATSVYGQQQGEWVDEQSATHPDAYNGKSLLAAENSIAKFSRNATSVRFSAIYGAARTGVIEKLHSRQQIQQSPPLYTNRIHQTDCIRVLHHLASLQLRGEKLAPVYVATDHDCAPKFEVMAWLAEQTGLGLPVALPAVAGAGQNKRCRNQKLLDTGFVFSYNSFKDGYRAMLALSGTQTPAKFNQQT